MGYQAQTGGQLANDGDFLSSPGFYHLCVTDCDDPATKKDGSLLDGAIMNLHCEVLDGNVAGQKKKPFQITLWEPKPGDRDGGAFRAKVLERYAIALGIVSGPNQVYSLEKSTVLLPKSTGQIVVHLDYRANQDGSQSKYLDVDGLKIYHVDDPAVAAIPKDASAIKLIPASLRRVATKAATTPANGTATPTQQRETVAAGAGASAGTNGIDKSNL